MRWKWFKFKFWFKRTFLMSRSEAERIYGLQREINKLTNAIYEHLGKTKP